MHPIPENECRQFSQCLSSDPTYNVRCLSSSKLMGNVFVYNSKNIFFISRPVLNRDIALYYFILKNITACFNKCGPLVQLYHLFNLTVLKNKNKMVGGIVIIDE